MFQVKKVERERGGQDADRALDVHERPELGRGPHLGKHDHGEDSRRLHVSLLTCSTRDLHIW